LKYDTNVLNDYFGHTKKSFKHQTLKTSSMIDMCGVNQQRNIVAREAIKNIDKSGQNTLVGFFLQKCHQRKSAT
jgi:hypothetical protein